MTNIESAEISSTIDTSEILNVKVQRLGFNSRVLNAFKKMGIATLGDLTSKTERELTYTRNLGPKSVEHIKEELCIIGLSLQMPVRMDQRAAVRALVRELKNRGWQQYGGYKFINPYDETRKPYIWQEAVLLELTESRNERRY